MIQRISCVPTHSRNFSYWGLGIISQLRGLLNEGLFIYRARTFCNTQGLVKWPKYGSLPFKGQLPVKCIGFNGISHKNCQLIQMGFYSASHGLGLIWAPYGWLVDCLGSNKDLLAHVIRGDTWAQVVRCYFGWVYASWRFIKDGTQQWFIFNLGQFGLQIIYDGCCDR